MVSDIPAGDGKNDNLFYSVWATARPGVKLAITIPDGSAFKFTGGSLASDFEEGRGRL